MKKLVIIGAGGHGKEIVWNLREMISAGTLFRHEIIGYCDDAKPEGTLVAGLPVWGTIEEAAHRFGRELSYVCGVAKNKVRPALVTRAEKAGWTPVSIIHPRAMIADDVQIGAGAYVAAGAYVGPGARIAPHAIVNVLASVGHDVVLEEHTQICPGAKLSGASVIRRGAFVGSNAVVAPGKVVGEWSTVSATAFVSTDIPARTLVVSPPSTLLAKPAKE